MLLRDIIDNEKSLILLIKFINPLILIKKIKIEITL